MKNLSIGIVFALLISPTAALSKPWPALGNMFYTTLKGKPPKAEATYGTDGTILFLNAPERADPGVYATIRVVPWGVHCGYGEGAGPFTECNFSQDNGHAPYLTGVCVTTTATSWEMTPDSTCAVRGFNGIHEGAAGGECVVFGKADFRNRYATVVSTPWGDVTAEQVANSRDTYCLHPVVPAVSCSLTVPDDGVIDHGTVSPTSSSSRSLSVALECGATPSVSIMGGNTINMGEGVVTNMSVHDLSPVGFTLRSDLTTTNAAPGPHQAAVMVIVSPQ